MSKAYIFDKLWKRYDEWYQRNPLIAELEVDAVACLIKRRPILEVGVGTGYFAYRLGFEYGVDPSFNMLLLAKGRNINVIQGVGEKLPFRSNAFGTIVFIVTLCFVDDVEAVLKEAYRVLIDGGDVIACIVPRESSWGKYYARKAKENHPFYSHARFMTVRELENYLVKTDFKVIEKVGVLSFKPTEKPRWESPDTRTEGKGFVCIKARKREG